MTQKRYTFTVTCSFTMQHTFDESEIEPDPGGNETDVEPTDRALLALARELEELSSTNIRFPMLMHQATQILLGTADE